LSKAEDAGSMRLNSVRSLLATMITPHFQTLMALVNHWNLVTKNLKATETQINELVNGIFLRVLLKSMGAYFMST
jgi:hypothetical protein